MQKIIFPLYLMLLINICCGQSTTTFVGNIEITQAADLLKHADLRIIQGSLSIKASSKIDLSQCLIQQVTEDVLIKNTDLKALNENTLPNLDSIGRMLLVEQNNALTSINGFNKLKYVGSIKIRLNPKLSNIHGFNALTQLHSDLEILNNDAFNPQSSKAIFEKLNQINGSLLLVGNNTMQNLPMLPQLKDIQQNLHVENNNLLKELSGIEALRRIDGDLIIKDHPHLNAINSLVNIEQISGKVVITNNPILNNCCTGLNKLNGIASGRIESTKNSANCNQVSACLLGTPNHQTNPWILNSIPNPIPDQWNLQLNYPAQVQLQSASGQYIYEQPLTQTQTLNLSNIPSGIYFLRIQTPNQVLNQRIIKK